jgi:hypothetical protein
MGMATLLKPTERMRAISSQLKPLCEVNYGTFILKHMWVLVCHLMGKFAFSHSGKSFCKGLTQTRWLFAQEAVHLHHQPDGVSAPGQVGEVALIAAMDA